MTDFLTKSELKKLQAAIDIEVKHQYIDIRGRECPFSVFMKKETKKIFEEFLENTPAKRVKLSNYSEGV